MTVATLEREHDISVCIYGFEVEQELDQPTMKAVAVGALAGSLEGKLVLMF
jgi:hypothetical protein